MKKDLHPEYNEEAAITCACGNNFVVGSTKKEIRVELCSMCHPFYTGKQKFVDTARRVEKFQEKMTRVKKAASDRKGKKVKRAAKAKKKQDTSAGVKTKEKTNGKKKKNTEKKTASK
jgi:large subunit ribosomal protein L31